MGNLSPLKCQYEYEETLNLIFGFDFVVAGWIGPTNGAAEVSAAEDKKLRRFIMGSIYFSCLTYVNILNK
jgi:hypothetical protein